jgi:hypothetical protein
MVGAPRTHDDCMNGIAHAAPPVARDQSARIAGSSHERDGQSALGRERGLIELFQDCRDRMSRRVRLSR